MTIKSMIAASVKPYISSLLNYNCKIMTDYHDYMTMTATPFSVIIYFILELPATNKNSLKITFPISPILIQVNVLVTDI